MDKSIEVYFDFLRYCIDDKSPIPVSIHDIDWDDLFAFMRQQTLTGIGYLGVARMKQEGVVIPRKIFLRWYALSEKIRARNIRVNKCCVELAEKLKNEGFCSCILKGQGNSLMYPDPYVRTSGDIDVFVMQNEDASIKERRKTILEWVKKRFPQTKMRYQHIDFPIFKDVAVEMHFIPTAKNNPIYNCRIQQWAERLMFQQCHNFVCLPDNVGTVATPTSDFNIIYQLSHLMHHFFDEGIGLRQMMDYYFLLKNYNGNRDRITADLKHLGMYKFAGAVMYVMQEVFGLEKERMLVPLDAKRGKTLMEEILKGGNFGKYSGLTNHSTGTKYFLKIRRNLRFVHEYPAEALCEPVFRTWHFFWRQRHKFV